MKKRIVKSFERKIDLNVSVGALEYDETDEEVKRIGKSGIQVISDISEEISIAMNEGLSWSVDAWNKHVSVEEMLRSIMYGRKLTPNEAKQLGLDVIYIHHRLTLWGCAALKHVDKLERLVERLNGTVFECDYV